jgi:hypothetical protein
MFTGVAGSVLFDLFGVPGVPRGFFNTFLRRLAIDFGADTALPGVAGKDFLDFLEAPGVVFPGVDGKVLFEP